MLSSNAVSPVQYAIHQVLEVGRLTISELTGHRGRKEQREPLFSVFYICLVISMQSTLLALGDRYSLSQKEILAELESILSEALSERYRLEITCHLRENLQIEIISHKFQDGVIKQHLAHIPKNLHYSKIQTLLEYRLVTSSVINQVRRLKTYEKQMIQQFPTTPQPL
jgi:hypothetical protein